ncbi:MAG: sialidase [Verrucomicrobia bacterium]|nr:MAG: sialidase [Verrucomicrobiota bacterium]
MCASTPASLVLLGFAAIFGTPYFTTQAADQSHQQKNAPLASLVQSSNDIIETVIAPATARNKRNSEGDIIVLKDGTILAAWSDFYGGSGDFAAARISAAKSTDGGRTWGHRYTLQENVGQQNVMSVSFLRSHSGDILFFYLVKNSRRDLDCVLRRSSDAARTWSEPVLITPEPGYYVMNNARVIQLKSGRILCPMSFTEEVWTRSEAFHTVTYFSDDDGRTWQRGKGIVRCPKRGAMEPGLVELKDGRVLQIIRTQLGQIWHTHSADGGDTWTEASPWAVAAPEAPSTLTRTADHGDLLLIYNPTVNLDVDHAGARTPLVAVVSTDEGKSWSKPKSIESDLDATYAYTSVTFLRDRALITYYVAPKGTDRLALKFKSIPLRWFRE